MSGFLSSPFLLKLYREKSEFLRVIYEFNTCFLYYAHSSWLSKLFPDVPSEMWDSLKVHRGCARYFSKQLASKISTNDEDANFYDFEKLEHRFALLPAQEVMDLLLFSGLARAFKNINSMVDRDSILRIRGAIGERGYNFSLRKAPFILGGSVPLVELKMNDNMNLEQEITKAGVACLKTLFADMSPAVLKKFFLKLPVYFEKEWEAVHALDAPTDSLKHFLRRVLLHEVGCRWANLLF